MRSPALLALLPLLALSAAQAGEPVALRVDSLILAPAHTPPLVVHVKNLGAAAYQGVIRVRGPEGWSLDPLEQPIALAAEETGQVRFTVRRGTTTEANLYPLEISAEGAGTVVHRQQHVSCTSAPYLKPEIDGNLDDWGDAIPVAWRTGGKQTVIRTAWNRRQFVVAVSVEEDALAPYQADKPEAAADAVQLAIAPQDTETGGSPDREATRYEFLLVASGDPPGGRCFRLAEPGMKLGECQAPRELGPLEFGEAKIAVGRREGTTCYECAIPWKAVPEIRPGEGREFCLSVLVHDPGGTGVRDWGAAAGLWPSERNRLAWSQWPGARWGDYVPLDNKTPWGLCSSKF